MVPGVFTVRSFGAQRGTFTQPDIAQGRNGSVTVTGTWLTTMTPPPYLQGGGLI